MDIELGKSEINAPNWIIVGFMANQMFENQIHDNSEFDQLPINFCVCKMGSENFPENGITCNYSRDNYCEAYYEIENFFKNYTETNLLKPLIDLKMFKSKYNFYVFDLRKQKEKIAAQPIWLNFKFDAAVADDYAAFALDLSDQLVSVSSDGQRQFDLI